MNRYIDHGIKPMLIGKEQPIFDDPDFIYELKLDGVRCIAYIEKDKVELRNKRNLKLNDKFPELSMIYKQVKHSCILDGELYIYKDERTDFFEIQKRTLTSDRFKIKLAASRLPATFTAFDVLYDKDNCMMKKTLMERKKVLSKLIDETARINTSRYLEEHGTALYELTCQKQLEGVVAKRKQSIYVEDKRTHDWIKCKNLLDDDYVICGYIPKEKGIVSLVLAQYDQDKLHYCGHVTMGVSLQYLYNHTSQSRQCPFHILPKGNDEAIWITPLLVGTVKFMEYTENGGLRQPVFKGFREDKKPEECQLKEN